MQSISSSAVAFSLKKVLKLGLVVITLVAVAIGSYLAGYRKGYVDGSVQEMEHPSVTIEHYPVNTN